MDNARRHPRKLAPPIWIALVVLSQDVIFFASTSASFSLNAFVTTGLLSVGLLIAFLLAIVTDPGRVPDGGWEYVRDTDRIPALQACRERKSNGALRHCKWCGKYKPDRTHHCRVCRKCVLKMDHHSPWVMNCIGHRNHRWFLLTTVLYSSLSINLFFNWRRSGELSRLSESSLVWGSVILWKYCEVGFFGVLLTLFSAFHFWLLMRNHTTIEFCEKIMSRRGTNDPIASIHVNRGLLANLCDVCFPDDGLRVKTRPPFQILVITTIDGGRVASFNDISPDDMVLTCKDKLKTSSGVPCSRQRLIMNNRVLDSSRSFWDQGARGKALALTLVKLPELAQGEEAAEEESERRFSPEDASAIAPQQEKPSCNPFASKPFRLLVAVVWVFAMLYAMWCSVSATVLQWLLACLLFALLTIMMIPWVLTFAKRAPRAFGRELLES